MTNSINRLNLLMELNSVGERLEEMTPGHPHMPGLFRRFDGIIKDLYRTGLTRDQIDTELDRL